MIKMEVSVCPNLSLRCRGEPLYSCRGTVGPAILYYCSGGAIVEKGVPGIGAKTIRVVFRNSAMPLPIAHDERNHMSIESLQTSLVRCLLSLTLFSSHAPSSAINEVSGDIVVIQSSMHPFLCSGFSSLARAQRCAEIPRFDRRFCQG